MKTELKGDLAMLDASTKAEISSAPGRIFQRLTERIAELDVRLSHIAQSGATLCEVTVRMANRVQVMVRHRDRDAARAAFTALNRARMQVSSTLAKRRRRDSLHLLPAAL